MRSSILLQLATASLAFVLPNEQVSNLEHVEMEARHGSQAILDRISSEFSSLREKVVPVAEEYKHKGEEAVLDRIPTTLPVEDEILQVLEQQKHALKDAASKAKNALDAAFQTAEHNIYSAKEQIPESYFDAQGWLDSTKEHAEWSSTELLEKMGDLGDKLRGDNHHHRPSGRCHHSHPTVYQLIAESKYTTKFAKLINEDEDLVKELNSTKGSFTVFAPVDSAFEGIPKKFKPPKEFVKALVSYHISPESYPLSTILKTKTIPTLLDAALPGPQRLTTNIGFSGLTLNFYSRVIAVNIFGSNGVIHGVNHIVLPPPKAAEIINILPIEFSTLTLGLAETGLFLNDTKAHNGGTLFAPSNWAFTKLGHGINAFLFSHWGKPYLKALLKYHIVPDDTLYSDAFYNGTKSDDDEANTAEGIPKGYYHYTLPTLLAGKPINVDIRQFGRLIDIKLNAFTSVAVSDGVAYDGVIQGLSDILLPPKSKSSEDGWFEKEWHGGKISLEEFKERLEPYIPAEELATNAPEDL